MKQKKKKMVYCYLKIHVIILNKPFYKYHYFFIENNEDSTKQNSTGGNNGSEVSSVQSVNDRGSRFYYFL